jgi:outer membrane immunogenic protein
MNRLLSITTALVSSVSLAWAGEDSGWDAVQEPRIATPNFWQGLYAGASFGFTSLNDRATQFDLGSRCWWSCASVTGLTDTSLGVIGGLQAGYNLQSGSVVLGFESDISTASNTGKLATFCDPSGACDYSQRSRLTDLDTLRGRLGYAFNRSLLYMTGGWAGGDLKNHINNGANSAVWDVSKWRNGWIAGGGLEYALSEAMSVKVEGLYYDLGDEIATFVYSGKGTSYFPAKFQNDGAIARVGLNFRLGDPAALLPARF